VPMTWRAISARPYNEEEGRVGGLTGGASALSPGYHGLGLTLVHISARLEPFLTQAHNLNTPSYSLIPPKHPLNNP